MSDKFFFDTNVLIYGIAMDAPAHRKIALDLLREVDSGSIIGCISTQVMLEFYNVASRKMKLQPDDAYAQTKLLDNFGIAHIDADMVRLGIKLSISGQISIWDAMIVIAAGSCDFLIVHV